MDRFDVMFNEVCSSLGVGRTAGLLIGMAMSRVVGTVGWFLARKGATLPVRAWRKITTPTPDGELCTLILDRLDGPDYCWNGRLVTSKDLSIEFKADKDRKELLMVSVWGKQALHLLTDKEKRKIIKRANERIASNERIIAEKELADLVYALKGK